MKKKEDIVLPKIAKLFGFKRCKLHYSQRRPDLSYEAGVYAKKMSSSKEQLIAQLCYVLADGWHFKLVFRENKNLEEKLEKYALHGEDIYASYINSAKKILIWPKGKTAEEAAIWLDLGRPM